MIGAGQLNRQVVLEKLGSAANLGGGLTETFAPVATVWARMLAIRDSAYLDGAQVADAATHRVTIRYRDAEDFDHLSEVGSTRRFRVQGVRDPDGRREMLDILAEELRP